MKAKTIIHTISGDQIKVKEDLDQVATIVAQMARSQPGSAYPFTRITDHGTQKRMFMPTGSITRVEEA